MVEEIRAAGGEAIGERGGSVTDFAAVTAHGEATLAAWGRVDILVNNAGILRDKSFAKMELEDFRLVVDVHLMGAVNCTKAVWETDARAGLRPHRVHRVLVRASTAISGSPTTARPRWRMVGLMQRAGLEGAQDDIRVNCLAPTAGDPDDRKLMRRRGAGPLPPDTVSPASRARGRSRALAHDPVRGRGQLRPDATSRKPQGVYLGEAERTAEGVAAHFAAISDTRTSASRRKTIPARRKPSPGRRTRQGRLDLKASR